MEDKKKSVTEILKKIVFGGRYEGFKKDIKIPFTDQTISKEKYKKALSKSSGTGALGLVGGAKTMVRGGKVAKQFFNVGKDIKKAGSLGKYLEGLVKKTGIPMEKVERFFHRYMGRGAGLK